jgi:hypothetical protein
VSSGQGSSLALSGRAAALVMPPPRLAAATAGAVTPDPVAPIVATVASLEPLSLQDLGAAALMDRIDTKFVVPSWVVPELLARCADRYRVLEVNGRRLGAYHTRYYDTPDLRLYHTHHAGRMPRYKVRVRSYLDTGTSFLELKLKTNKCRTVKTRVPLESGRDDPLARLSEERFFGIAHETEPESLEQTLTVEYSRMTLVSRDVAERITVDVMLTLARDGAVRSLPGVAIVEVKQARHGDSVFREALREFNLRPGGVSKYCLGIALLEPRAKKNRFRPRLRRIEKMEDDRCVLLGT